MAKKLKPSYKTLKNIKKPVLIVAKNLSASRKDLTKFSRLRILYPNGRCEYFHEAWSNESLGFETSCFSEQDLAKTVEGMARHDRHLVKIVEIIEL
jgi:hypothetical protein